MTMRGWMSQQIGATDVGVDLSTQVAQDTFPQARDSIFRGTIDSVTVEILGTETPEVQESAQIR